MRPNRFHVLFSYGFRPFFLLLGVYAVVIVTLWGLILAGMLDWSGSVSAFIAHGHEMVFGFAGCAIAGFLLTAVATWTGRPPIAGPPLLLLSGLWLLARIAALGPDWSSFSVWAAGSCLFWLTLSLLIAREVFAARNTRNYKVPALLLAFLIAEVVFFAAGPEHGDVQAACVRLGLFLVLGMISLVGGRILPAFTQNWLRANRPQLAIQLPTLDRLDQVAVILMAMFAVAWVVVPDEGGTGWLGLAAAAAQAARVIRWRGWLAGSEPLLWILHLGYAWIPIGFALLGLASITGWGLRDAGLHALAYGAIGTLILAVAARVALGHTGRPLMASARMRWAFVLISVGTLGRLASLFASEGLWLSAVAWVAAYGLFISQYAPILLQPRVDDKG